MDGLRERREVLQRAFNVECGGSRLTGCYRDKDIIMIEIIHPHMASIILEVNEIEKEKIIEGLTGLKYTKPSFEWKGGN